MDFAAPRHPVVSRPSVGVVVTYVVAYVVLDWVSYIDPIASFAITPWNPPPGLSLAFLLRYGVRQGGWLFVAAFGADLLVRGGHAPWPVLVAAPLLLAGGYTALAWALVGPLRLDPAFRTLRDAAVFSVAAAAGTALVAVMYVALLGAAGVLPSGQAGGSLAQFWIGDLIGIVVTTPALSVLTRGRLPATPRLTWEVPAQALAIVAALWLVFGSGLGDEFKLFYVLFLPIVWIAMREGLEGAALGAVAIQVGLIVALHLTNPPAGATLQFQVLMLALAATGLFLGSAVSERRAIEQALREKQTELDQRLRLAAASELASALAHELNQPLAAMTNYVRACQLMLREHGAGADELSATMDKVVGEAVRAGEVVRRLREFYRTGSGRWESTDLRAVVGDVLDGTRERATRHHVRIALDAPAALPAVHADRVQLEAVIHNLVGNAIDALKETANGERIVRVVLAAGEGTVRVTVEDTGRGVAPEIAARLFEPMATTKPHGMGMGLAIARSIAEAHGGTLAYAPLPQGSSFTLTLPAAP
jgi:signal transduction histidine kinase